MFGPHQHFCIVFAIIFWKLNQIFYFLLLVLVLKRRIQITINQMINTYQFCRTNSNVYFISMWIRFDTIPISSLQSFSFFSNAAEKKKWQPQRQLNNILLHKFSSKWNWMKWYEYHTNINSKTCVIQYSIIRSTTKNEKKKIMNNLNELTCAGACDGVKFQWISAKI